MIESMKWANGIILLFLAVIHVYWALDGQWAKSVVIPTTEKGIPVFQPRKGGTFVVACCLFIAAMLNVQFIATGAWVYLILGLVFGLRVLGDFNYVGLSKKVKTLLLLRKMQQFLFHCVFI